MITIAIQYSLSEKAPLFFFSLLFSKLHLFLLFPMTFKQIGSPFLIKYPSQKHFSCLLFSKYLLTQTHIWLSQITSHKGGNLSTVHKINLVQTQTAQHLLWQLLWLLCLWNQKKKKRYKNIWNFLLIGVQLQIKSIKLSFTKPIFLKWVPVKVVFYSVRKLNFTTSLTSEDLCPIKKGLICVLNLMSWVLNLLYLDS